jgi:NodT family efflux transporter outer membrane factor (OMF) lipoprotein
MPHTPPHIAPSLPENKLPRSRALPVAASPLAAALLGLSLSACAVVPAYQPPASDAPAHYTGTKLAKQTAKAGSATGNNSQRLRSGETPARWWRQFKSPQLDTLIRDGFEHSPTLAASRATLRQYVYLASAAGAAYYPSIGINGSATRQRSPKQGATPPLIYNTFAGNLTVSYNPDVFGRTGYARQSAAAQAQQHRFELQAAYQTLAGNIASTTIQAAGYQAQIDATRHILRDRQRMLKLVEEQYRLGSASYSDVLTQRSEVANARASLSSLRQSFDQTRNQLATLTGRYPSDDMVQLPQLDRLTLPADIPVGLPSKLTQERPDIRAAEAGLRATYAQYGLAYAQRFPSFAITGAFGQGAPKLSDLGESAYNLWNIALSASATLFDAGALKDKSQAAKAAFEASTASYRSTVLDAFKQVADGLRALNADAEILKARKDALDAAQGALTIIHDQYRLGSADYQSLLTAQINASQTHISYLQALQQRYLDTAALYVALGGQAWPAEDNSSTSPTTHS